MKQFISDLSDMLYNNGWTPEETTDFINDFWEFQIEGNDAMSFPPEKFEALLAFDIADHPSDGFEQEYPKRIARTLTDKYIRVAAAA